LAASAFFLAARAGADFDFLPPDLPPEAAPAAPARATFEARPKTASKSAIFLVAAAKLFRLDIMISLLSGPARGKSVCGTRRECTYVECRRLKLNVCGGDAAELFVP
jgi:hypothetical protein